LDKLDDDIAELVKLRTSVKPVTYVGRIIVSTTDDTEKKVVEHYGGKRWRRVENFLRGVGVNDWTIGDKIGEEYVCLREQNIPMHVHQMEVNRASAAG
jgi:hypothetical protein